MKVVPGDVEPDDQFVKDLVAAEENFVRSIQEFFELHQAYQETAPLSSEAFDSMQQLARGGSRVYNAWKKIEQRMIRKIVERKEGGQQFGRG
jgi:hypothetical protein